MSAELGWTWLGLLAGALTLALWQNRAANVLPALAIIGFCASVQAAAAFDTELAVASALRWSLGIWFVVCSVLVWQRGTLARMATAVGIKWDVNQPIAGVVRVVLMLTAVVPVLVLTAVVAAIGFAHQHASGPLEESLFAEMGSILNNIVPLALLCFGLLGHGIRESHAPVTPFQRAWLDFSRSSADMPFRLLPAAAISAHKSLSSLANSPP